MEKKGKKVISPFFPHPRNNSLTKKTPYPSQYHLIKLFYFSSSLKPHILKKPFERPKKKNFNPYPLLAQL
jgi:hypothetical protein